MMEGGHDHAPTDERRPLYVQIAATLEQRITGGDYAVGALLPTEAELCRSFGVSRYVVRQAIQHLRGLGLVTARKGVGTRVEARTPETRYLHSMRSLDEILQYAQETRLEVVASEERVARGDLATALGCRSGRRWLKIDGIRYDRRDDRPICLSEVYVDEAFAEVVDDIPEARTPIWAMIERRFGETLLEVEQVIESTVLDESQAGTFALAAGAPALRIIRRYFATGRRLIEVSINLHPADRFSYAMTIRRDHKS